MKAYEESGQYFYEDKEKDILIDYDLVWKRSTAFNNEGCMEDLTMFFDEVPTLKGFEKKAKQILKDNPYLLA
jgi:hypothetical protein